jgi:hypothetical protein
VTVPNEMAMIYHHLRNTNPKGKPPTRHNGQVLPNIVPNLTTPGKLHITMDEGMENINLTGEAAGHLCRYEISIHAKSFEHYDEGTLKFMAHLIINGRGENGVVNPSVLTPLSMFPTEGGGHGITPLDNVPRPHPRRSLSLSSPSASTPCSTRP